MKLGFPDSIVSGCIILKILNQFIRGWFTEGSKCSEILNLEQSGDTFRDLSFIVTHSMEVRATW